MAIIVSQIKMSLEEKDPIQKALKKLKLKPEETKASRIFKSSVDARGEVQLVYSVYLELISPKKERQLAEKRNDVRLYEKKELSVNFGKEKPDGRIFIAGFGPAGMFCALTLCEFGYKPVILERGAAMEQRIAAVERYWETGKPDPCANVQFGEGGAGTFSDGKLTTRINDPLCTCVLERFVEFGAPEDILTSAKPHIGTDKLRFVVTNLRRRVSELGGEVRFLAKLDDITIKCGKVVSIKTNGAFEPCGALVLAVGHSAHDTFEMLLKNGVELVPKPFSVGARIEHLQSDIDAALYGKYAGHPALPPAEYQLSCRQMGRGIYTFCMCPGGYVVASASGDGSIVTNGMSLYSRSGDNANSAVLASVSPEDFGNEPLSGVEFIRSIERRAFELGARVKSGRAPAMLTREFVGDGGAFSLGKVTPTYLPGVEAANLRELFPGFIAEPLALGIKYFDKHIAGFSDSDSVLTAAETRTSSPVRIPRSENGAVCGNLYPCGEGAGYAGGIMSAAVDGISTAIKIMERFSSV